MSCIATDGNTTYHLLQVSLRSEDVLLALHYLEQMVVVTGNTGQINRDNSLGIRSHGLLHSVIVHLEAILLHIDKDERSPNMFYHRSTCRIGISRHNHLITFAYAQQPQRHFGTSRLRVQAYCLVHTHKFGHFLFQLLCVRSGCYPTRQNGITHFCRLSLRHIRRRERHITQFHCHNMIINIYLLKLFVWIISFIADLFVWIISIFDDLFVWIISFCYLCN